MSPQRPIFKNGYTQGRKRAQWPFTMTAAPPLSTIHCFLHLPRHQTSSVPSEYHPVLPRKHWRQCSTPQRFGDTGTGHVGASVVRKIIIFWYLFTFILSNNFRQHGCGAIQIGNVSSFDASVLARRPPRQDSTPSRYASSDARRPLCI